MTDYDQKAVIEGEAFEQMRNDANRVLQRLLKNMVEKDTGEGTMTIKIDVTFLPEYITIPVEMRTEASGESRKALKPQFKHKISSTMQVRDDASGRCRNETMELVWDKDTESYILTPVTGEEQMNIFDVMKQEETQPFMPLPGPGQEEAAGAPATDETDEDDVIDAGFREVDACGDSDDLDVPEEEDEDIDSPDEDDDLDLFGGYEYQDYDCTNE